MPGLPSQLGLLPDFDDRGTVRDLAVTPFHLARVVAALELGGQLPRPTLSLEAASATPERTQAIGPDTAHYLRSLLPQADAQIIGLIGQATPKETGQRWLSWFVGLAPAKAVQAEATLKGAGAEPKAPYGQAEAELVLNPSQIIPTTPTPAPSAEHPAARYAVVAVVVTDKADSNAALRIARAPVRVILERE